MTRLDAHDGGRFGSCNVNPLRKSVPGLVDDSHELLLSRSAVAEFVLGAPQESVIALGGIDSKSLRALVDQIDPKPDGRRALFAPIVPAPTTEVIVEQIIGLLAEAARRLWPIWFTDVSFSGCRRDSLGRLAAGIIARGAAREISGVSTSWAEEAARFALDDGLPRVKGTLPAIELAQLALVINRFGLVLVMDVPIVGSNPAAAVHALEWTAQHSHGAVVALFPELPPNEPPFDRIMYGARFVDVGDAPFVIDVTAPSVAESWISPWRGLPHPLSEIEQRLAKVFAADAELAPLFVFNQFIETVRGSRPKVDLVWMEGRLVVELDGYESHGNRRAFMDDRHRDYELSLSGYTVLRLANEEIVQDIEKATEKIRDLVRLRRTYITEEG